MQPYIYHMPKPYVKMPELYCWYDHNAYGTKDCLKGGAVDDIGEVGLEELKCLVLL